MSIFDWFKKKEQKGAIYSDSLEIDDLSQLYTDAYIMKMKLDPRYVGNSSVEPSGSIYGHEIYEFIDSCSGTSHYKSVDGRIFEYNNQGTFILCRYCGSKHNAIDLECRNCGAPL